MLSYITIIWFIFQENGVFWPALGETLTLGAFVVNCVAQSGNRDMTFNLSNKVYIFLIKNYVTFNKKLCY